MWGKKRKERRQMEQATTEARLKAMDERDRNSFRALIDQYKVDEDVIKMVNRIDDFDWLSTPKIDFFLKRELWEKYHIRSLHRLSLFIDSWYGEGIGWCIACLRPDNVNEYFSAGYLSGDSCNGGVKLSDFGIAPVENDKKRAALCVAFAEIISDKMKQDPRINEISVSGVITASSTGDDNRRHYSVNKEWDISLWRDGDTMEKAPENAWPPGYIIV